MAFLERLAICYAAAVISCFVPICQYPPSKGSISYLVSYHFVILSHNKCLQSGNFTINVLYNSLKLACWRSHLVSLHSLSSLEKKRMLYIIYYFIIVTPRSYLKTNKKKWISKDVLFQKLSISFSWRVFWFQPPRPNSQKLELRFIFSLKILGFENHSD